MMPELQQQLDELRKHWFVVEQRLKACEFLRGSALVAAVFSMRYAGRQQAIIMELLNKPELTTEEVETVRQAIGLVDHYLYMAEDDIVDGSVGVIRERLRHLIERFGEMAIREIEPALGQLQRHLTAATDLIIESRGYGENAERRALYRRMEDNHLPEILKIYERLDEGGPALLVRNRRRTERRERLHIGLASYGVALALLLGLPGVLELIVPNWTKMALSWIWPALTGIGVWTTYRFLLHWMAESEARAFHRRWRLLEYLVLFVGVLWSVGLVFPETVERFVGWVRGLLAISLERYWR
jgi:hypothetical protein